MVFNSDLRQNGEPVFSETREKPDFKKQIVKKLGLGVGGGAPENGQQKRQQNVGKCEKRGV